MAVFFREHATTSPLLIMSVTPTLASTIGTPFSRARAITVLSWSFERDPYDGINRYCAPSRTGIRAMSGFQRSLQMRNPLRPNGVGNARLFSPILLNHQEGT